MRLGAQFLCEDFDEYIASVVKAEDAGYAFAWLVDSQILWQDAYAYMTRGLGATERITFGTAVTNPVTRHVTVTASFFATLAKLHPGRVALGIGRGDSSVRTMGLPPARTSQLAQYVTSLRELMAGRVAELDGAEVHLRWLDGDGGVPIMMSGTGPKNLRLAGALADRVMLYVGVTPEAVSWAIEHVRAGAQAAGRDPAEVKTSILCAMHVSDDHEAAADACRWAPAACANHIAVMAKHNPDHGMPQVMLRLLEARDSYDYYAGHLDSTASHTAYLTTELIDDFAIAGPVDACLQKLRALSEIGVDEVSVAYNNGAFEQMERVGSDIIPALAAPTANATSPKRADQ
jgi:alkanesulfonate monooxygenase SsuD/methylene tetrahydromethanopterin reductase-like flavin-dependent oxidoreductase (luciferase family)